MMMTIVLIIFIALLITNTILLTFAIFAFINELLDWILDAKSPSWLPVLLLGINIVTYSVLLVFFVKGLQ